MAVCSANPRRLVLSAKRAALSGLQSTKVNGEQGITAAQSTKASPVCMHSPCQTSNMQVEHCYSMLMAEVGGSAWGQGVNHLPLLANSFGFERENPSSFFPFSFGAREQKGCCTVQYCTIEN